MSDDATYSDGHVSPPDFYNLIVRSRGCPDGWQWVSVEGVGSDRASGGARVKGGVYSTTFKSGKNKGRPNLGKPDPGTEKELLITFADLDAFKEQWERETGKCHDCGGSGEQLSSCGIGGNKYRPCARCRKAAP